MLLMNLYSHCQFTFAMHLFRIMDYVIATFYFNCSRWQTPLITSER